MGNAHQAGAARDAEGRREGRRGADALVVGQAESDDIARRASVRASRGCFIREAATMTPMSTPVSAEAERASSMMISSAGVMPPT